MYRWILFETREKAEIADLQIAANMTAMFPLNPQEHFSYITNLKDGGIEIDGKTLVCGFRKVDLEGGYTQVQVDGYLSNVEWDAEADYDYNWLGQEV
jgi:hypothetical protein